MAGEWIKKLEDENENMKTSLEDLEKAKNNSICNCKKSVPNYKSYLKQIEKNKIVDENNFKVHSR